MERLPWFERLPLSSSLNTKSSVMAQIPVGRVGFKSSGSHCDTTVMQLQEILYTQGFGTRRVCAGLIQQGLVQVYMPNEGPAPVTIAQAATEFVAEGLRFRVQGVDWPYAERAYLMLHKPAGTECSQKPSTYPSIYTLLPSPLRLRPQKAAVQGVQAVAAGPGHHRHAVAHR